MEYKQVPEGGKAKAARDYDFIIYGASGFTGEYVVEKMVKALAAEEGGKELRFAVAGRNEVRLKATLAKVGGWLDQDLSTIPIVLADSSDPASLTHMAESARVVLNCVGPYAFYGEPVVAACVEAGTSHVDLSGEPRFLEGMQAKYSKAAAEKGCYIVGACGWDSIPFDLGMQIMAKQFKGTLNDVEGLPHMKAGPGYHVNFGTFHSMINGVANRGDLRSIRKEIMPDRFQPGQHRPPKRQPLFFHDGAQAWCLPFLGSDKSVAQRSQYLVKEADPKHRSIQPETYYRFTSLLWAVLLAMWGVFFGIMTQFSFTRKLLEKYPEIFSFGLFGKEGPSREAVAGSSFTYHLYGRGWAEGKTGPEGDEPPTDKITLVVAGPEAAYEATSSFLVNAALTIRLDKEQIPGTGGVIPPGYAFAATKLQERLARHGITFRTLNNSTKEE